MYIFSIGQIPIVMNSDLQKLTELNCTKIPGFVQRLSTVMPGLEHQIDADTRLGQIIKSIFNVLNGVAEVSSEAGRGYLIQSSFDLARALVEDDHFDFEDCIQMAELL